MTSRAANMLMLVLALWGAWAPCAMAKPVLFHRGPDITAPEIVSATIASNGTSLTVVFDEPVLAANATGFAIAPSFDDATLTLASGSGTASLVFTISRTIYDDELGSLTYLSSAGNVTDVPRNVLADGVMSVTNNSTQEPTPSGVTISSATINSAGTTLTVVLSGTATISDATGWSLTFDNNASRTLTYTSGSGTSTFVFTLTAVSPSTDGRAPTGTVCVLAYQSGPGNVSDLGDADQSVTNNSTVIPDPDLPQNVPTAALPSNWDDAADHTPANKAALQSIIDAWTPGTGGVIELTAGVDYEGGIVLPATFKGTEASPIIIRSSGWASLPTFSTTDSSGRVATGDESNMATISRAPTDATHYVAEIRPDLTLSGAGASYVRFVGIKFIADGTGYTSSNYLAVISCINGTTSVASEYCPKGIVFDRCAVTCGDSVNVYDGLAFNANDSAVVGCNFYNLWGGGSDGSNAIRNYRCSRQLIKNNYFQVMSSAYFLGSGSNPTVETNDIDYSRNHHIHPTAWDDGSHGNTKSSYETKVGTRLLIEENVFENQALASYNQGHAIISIKGEKNETNHLTVRGNRFISALTGFTLMCAASNSDASSGPNTDMLIVDNFVEAATRGARYVVGDFSGGSRMSRVQMLSNTFVTANDFSFYFFNHNSGAAAGNNWVFKDNVVTRGGMWADGAAEGSLSLNYAWDADYAVTNNILVGRAISAYDNDTTPSPLGTLSSNYFPANVAAVGFTDSGSGDYSISNSSIYKTSSSTGGKPGYDSTTYDPIWVEVRN